MCSRMQNHKPHNHTEEMSQISPKVLVRYFKRLYEYDAYMLRKSLRYELAFLFFQFHYLVKSDSVVHFYAVRYVM